LKVGKTQRLSPGTGVEQKTKKQKNKQRLSPGTGVACFFPVFDRV